MSKGASPKHSRFDPEIELIIAVFRKARQDLVGKGTKPGHRQSAERFLRGCGFDPQTIVNVWGRQ